MAEPSYIEGKQRDRKAAQLQAKKEARWNAKHDTMSGMTVQQAKKVRELEDEISDKFTEKAYIIGKDGQVITESYTNNKSSANLTESGKRRGKDAVMIHNHPNHEFTKDGSSWSGSNPKNTGMGARIGDSLSYADLMTAAHYDMAEVRARTPTYEFSVKRGENGWGASAAEIQAFFEKEYAKQREYYKSLKGNKGDLDSLTEHSGRFSAMVNHKAVEAAAKKFGWKYTRMKRKERSDNDAKYAGKTKEMREAEAKERILKQQTSAFKRALRKHGYKGY